MNKKLVGIVVVVLVLVAGGAFAYSYNANKADDLSSGAYDTASGKSHSEHTEEEMIATLDDLTGQSEVAIDIQDYAYSWQNIKITKGTKVTWTNRDPVEHNVVKTAGETELGQVALDGPLLKTGESYSYTFDSVGKLSYFCSPHPYMTGYITVVE